MLYQFFDLLRVLRRQLLASGKGNHKIRYRSAKCLPDHLPGPPVHQITQGIEPVNRCGQQCQKTHSNVLAFYMIQLMGDQVKMEEPLSSQPETDGDF